MKAYHFARLVLYFFSTFTIISCSEDEVIYQEPSNKVSFVNQSQTITQEMESISIPLKFDLKAITGGYITIELAGNAVYGNDFTTIPHAVNNKLNINLVKNTKDTSFVVLRKNILTTEKLINFKLSNPTEGFSLGSRINSEVKLTAQTPVSNKLNFDTSSGTISEGNSTGIIIGLNTTSTVSNGSHAKVKLIVPEGILYGTHFYTIPVTVLNEISLEFNQNAQSTSFKIIPINDNIILGDYSIGFEIIEAAGGFEIGPHKVFTATILENDNATGIINTIAQLKSKFNKNGDNWYLPKDYLIEGVITSNGNTADNKSVYIQDSTGGILIQFTTPNIFSLGDKIRLNLASATGTLINGQKGINQVNLNGFAKYSENVFVIPEIITIAQFRSGNYEGKKVKIENVKFMNADNKETFYGSRIIRHDADMAAVITYQTASFWNTVLPQGTLSITGIAGDWGALLPQKYSHDINY
ncbi:DUF5689 domain-containing protein [Mariniflexile litorale]|uniref:DUF5689 domain-containing protein n=1 Tax=Mariniflexile litorale TaxID=3045158 RepID=A0AAU7EGT6_9FLAO|nr:DUF5689 domain-containing protein [Mariniflexile sp. KMM 9835]MDQ8211996.1 DUF5689 domain-containing protein [Mariniflexile sp. KMM 9835]